MIDLDSILEKENITPLDDDYDYYTSISEMSPLDDDYEYYKRYYERDE